MNRFPLFNALRLLAALAILTLSAQAAEMSPEDRASLLARIEALHAKSGAVAAGFTERRNSRLLQQPLVSEGEISFQTPGKFRRELRGANPSLAVSNGQTLWLYYPKFGEAERYRLGQRAFFDDSLAAMNAGLNFERIDEFYRVRAYPEPPGYRIELIPKKANIKRVIQSLSIWLDPELNIRNTEVVLPKGERIQTSYSNLRRTPLPASTFEFTPPSGTRVSEPMGK